MNKQKLRELAEKATPGKWINLGAGDSVFRLAVATEDNESLLTIVHEGDTAFATFYEDDDARFVASANPATVLALLDENAALLEALKEVRKWLDDMGFAVDDIDAVIAKYSESAS